MAINLEKLRSDLGHNDTQIQTFALMCITRLSPQVTHSADEIRGIRSKLGDLASSSNPDVVFLARKAINHIETSFGKSLAAPAVATPAAALRSIPEPVPVAPAAR